MLAWQEMAKTIGKTDFLWVSDCKGSALETRSQMAKRILFVSSGKNGQNS